MMGFTNTSILLKNVDIPTFIPSLIASDWFFFTKLIQNGASSIFTNEAISYYRQHENNTLGIGDLNHDVYMLTVDIKLQHYKIFKHLGSSLDEIVSLSKPENLDEHLQ